MIATVLFAATNATHKAAAGSLIPYLIAIMALMYFVFLRPQKKKALKKQAEAKAFEVGDDVATVGGIIGRVTAAEGDRVWLELDAGVVVEFLRQAIAKRIDPVQPSAPEEPEWGGETAPKATGGDMPQPGGPPPGGTGGGIAPGLETPQGGSIEPPSGGGSPMPGEPGNGGPPASPGVS